MTIMHAWSPFALQKLFFFPYLKPYKNKVFDYGALKSFTFVLLTFLFLPFAPLLRRSIEHG